MKKIYIFLLLIAVSTSFVTAQNKNTKKADELYNRLSYTDAAVAYQKLMKKGDGSRYVFEQLAHCYYFVNDTKKAETFYKRVVKGRKVKAETVYNYAQTLKSNGKFGDYNTWMKKFAQMKPNDSRAIAFMKDPNYLPRFAENAKKFTVTNLKDINSKFSDYGGTVSNKSFYFSSARNTSRKTYGWNDEPFLDVYVADLVGDTVKNADLISGDVNTKYHEGTVAITPDGKRMYFDRNDYYKGKYKKSTEGINQINMYTAELVDGSWKDIQPASVNNDEYSEGQPALSPDGNTLYYSSDVPGGKGGADLYKVSVNKDGSLGLPKRLGDNINTEGSEVFPFVDANGTLYFSSDGHLGLGELDVFYAEANGSGFGKAVNMGTDINSPKDDFAIKYNPATGEGYVSSNRKGGVGNDDIYSIKKIESCDVTVNVQVINEITKAPLSSVRTEIFDAKGNKLSTKTTDMNGKTSFVVTCNEKYEILAMLDNFESNGTIVNTSKKDTNEVITLNPIEEIIIDNRVVLNPILFDYDKHNIKPQAAFELDKLVAIMKKYPSMIIKIESHTDSRGKDSYNMGLSHRRAMSTMEYVISKGIDKSRLSSEGFGETRPVIDCGNKCTKEQYHKNRRSEFIIVKR